VKRLLTIGHSYVVAMNRRLADEMARQGGGRWRVTAGAPAQYHGDFGPIELERLEDEACDVVSLPVHFDRSPHLMTYGRLAPLMKQRWDVVHCWEEPYVMAAAQIAGAAPRECAFVFSTFQNLVKSYPPPFNWIERRVVRRANGWIAFGRTIHDAQQRRRGYADIPSRILPAGVDIGAFAPDPTSRARVRAAQGWDESVPVIGFAGRFVPEKGLDLLIRVLHQLERPWRALFVGGGPELPHLQALAAAFPDGVSIAAGVTHSEMPAFYNAMDVLCAPSRTTLRWQEQFGRMLIEGMACGVAIVASRSGEIPNVVGDAGMLLPEADPDAWTAALTRLLRDSAARRELAERGLRRARTEFAWPIVAKRHLDFFDELTDGR
jgi:glycosyltransferase involved in cell wall biosynthesis